MTDKKNNEEILEEAIDEALEEVEEKKISLDEEVSENEECEKKDVEKIIECSNCVDLDNKYKRALADYQNLMKQSSKEKLEFAKYANLRILEDILPVYDNLKVSLLHVTEAVDNNWLEGIKYVIKQFKTVLEDNGIKEIETKNKAFDHNLMEAIEEIKTEDKKLDGMVAEERKPGYILNERVVAAARVIVYKFEKAN